MRISCSVSYDEVEGEFGHHPGVRVTCSRCQAIETAGGEHERSIKRCLVQLRENCPRDENNFYETEGAR